MFNTKNSFNYDRKVTKILGATNNSLIESVPFNYFHMNSA